jgi:1,4-dihydroxy-2-naphthoate octaprenyltransferase
VSWGPAAAALVGALAIQVGTNFANDVYDAERGADGPDRMGPTRAVATGLISARAMKRAMVLTFVVASCMGAYLTTIAGWPIIAIGVASIVAGITYTGGPWPLGYHGLGDVFVFGFFGVVAVSATAYVQRGEVHPVALWSSLAVGALATAILVVNNLRDRVTDQRVGKRTLAVRFGRRFALAEYALLVGCAYAVAVVLAVRMSSLLLLLPLASTPLALVRFHQLRSLQGPALNAVLAGTAQLLLVYSVLLSAALVLVTR